MTDYTSWNRVVVAPGDPVELNDRGIGRGGGKGDAGECGGEGQDLVSCFHGLAFGVRE